VQRVVEHPGGREHPSETATTAALTGTLTVWVDETRINDIKPVAESFQAKTGVVLDLVQDALYSTGGRVPALKASAAKINDPILAGFNEAGATGAPMPSIPEMGSVWGFWGTTEVQIIGGQAADPAAAWTTMVDNITAAIKG